MLAMHDYSTSFRDTIIIRFFNELVKEELNCFCREFILFHFCQIRNQFFLTLNQLAAGTSRKGNIIRGKKH